MTLAYFNMAFFKGSIITWDHEIHVCSGLGFYIKVSMHCIYIIDQISYISCNKHWMSFHYISYFHGLQYMNATVFDHSWTFPLAHHEVDVCGFEWNVPTAVGWIVMNFGTGSYVPDRMNKLCWSLNFMYIYRHHQVSMVHIVSITSAKHHVNFVIVTASTLVS